MKKKVNILGIVCIIIFAVIMLLPFIVKGSNQGVDFDPSSYEQSQDIISIHNLRVEAKVNKNNTINIRETFDVTFNKEGLTEVVRVVPYKNIVYREVNGKVQEEVVASKITNIEASGGGGKETFYTDEISGTVTIGIKNSARYNLGETHSFIVEYDYEMGKDYNRRFDEVYFNIVGVNSTLTIENVSFMIELPEDVVEDNINIYYGEEGSIKNLEYTYGGNVVVGQIDKLNPTEGITFRAVYKDGFLTRSTSINGLEIAVIVIACLMIGLAVFYIIKVKQRHKVITPVELLVPKGLTPFKAEFYDQGLCSDKSIISGIVCLASKGYLTINETKEKDIELIKRKDILDSEVNSLKALFNAIFRKNNVVNIKNLDADFSVSANAIKESEEIKTSAILFDSKIEKIASTIRILMTFGLIFLSSVLVYSNVMYFGFKSSFYNLKLVLLSVVMLIYTFMLAFDKKTIIYRYICSALIVFMLFYLYFGLGFKYVNDNFIYLVFLILALASTMIVQGDSKYSAVGAKQKGETLGFKNFIELCEVDQIKAFAEENPSYYFDVLPYAYVFNLSNVWIKKFENINLTTPDWITTETGTITDYVMFNMVYNNFATRTMTTARELNVRRIQSQYASSGSSSRGRNFGGGRSGGSFGGGGFSGGGRGGGGFGAR